MMKKMIMNKNITQTHIIRRSNIMKSLFGNALANRGLLALLITTFITVTALGQNLAITGSPTLAGSGTYVVKGNITNTAAVTISPTVTMSGTAAQTVGTTGAITFGTLNVNTTAGGTTLNVAANASALSVAAACSLIVGSNTLTLSGTSTLNSTGVLSTVSGSTVVFNQTGTTQAVLASSYAGALTLSGTSAKTLGGDVTVAGTFSHTGGNLTIGNNLTISSASPSFAIITNVATGKTLTLSGTGSKSIATVTDITGTGSIANTGTAGLLTIGTLTNNSSTANGIVGGAGGVTFTNAATNSGIITGGAGALTFSNTLAMSGGTLTAGAGDITFSGAVTQTAGSIASSALANLVKFSSSYSNSGGGTLDLTSTGAAEFDGTVTAGTFNLASGSTVTYGGASQAIADMGYAGNLTLSGGTKTWTLGAARTIGGTLTLGSSSATAVTSAGYNLNVTGNVSLASNLTVSGTGALAFAQATSAVSGTGYEIVGNVTRTHTFTASTAYTFNNASMTVTPTTVGTLSSLTVQSNPSTAPTNYVAGNSVDRKYYVSYTGSGFTATMQLAFLATEYTGSLTAKLKDFNGGIAKANKISGTYTYAAASNGFSTLSLPGITASSFTSGNEIDIDDRYNTFNSIATANWNVASTWDATAIPSATDDIVITGGYTVTVPDAITANALSVTINGAAANTLVVGGGASGILNVGTGGLTNGSSGNTSGVLTVSAGANLNFSSGSLSTFGAITNNGTITVQ
jgi:hypothetical protein